MNESFVAFVSFALFVMKKFWVEYGSTGINQASDKTKAYGACQ
jgi:hypothetical protein